MKNHIKTALIGGTGKSGKYVQEELLRKGPACRVLVRNPVDVRRMLQGCGAVISTLGQSAGEVPVFSRATQNVLNAMQYHGLQPYIVTTGLGVDTPADRKSAPVQQATCWMYAHYPETTADKQKEYDLLCRSAVSWTLVQPAGYPGWVATEQPVRLPLARNKRFGAGPFS